MYQVVQENCILAITRRFSRDLQTLKTVLNNHQIGSLYFMSTILMTEALPIR